MGEVKFLFSPFLLSILLLFSSKTFSPLQALKMQQGFTDPRGWQRVSLRVAGWVCVASCWCDVPGTWLFAHWSSLGALGILLNLRGIMPWEDPDGTDGTDLPPPTLESQAAGSPADTLCMWDAWT